MGIISWIENVSDHKFSLLGEPQCEDAHANFGCCSSAEQIHLKLSEWRAGELTEMTPWTSILLHYELQFYLTNLNSITSVKSQDEIIKRILLSEAEAVTQHGLPLSSPYGMCWSEPGGFRILVSFINVQVHLTEFRRSPWMLETDVMSPSAKVLCWDHHCMWNK